MTHYLTEDDIYRTSTQYRLWSFSPEKLASLRRDTHGTAIARAREHLAEESGTDAANVQFLTLDEEVRLVQRYCSTLSVTCDHLKFAANVKVRRPVSYSLRTRLHSQATAIQYLKRFYLANSVHTYPPKEVYKSVLWLASKSEGTHLELSEYALRMKSPPEQILAPEYKIIQALRFTLDVRQPYRGLKGALMELLNMASGTAAVLPFVGRTPQQLQQDMADLPFPAGTRASSPTDRVLAAYGSARLTVDMPALLTDVYFLYTPPQIYLAALHLADPILTTFYLDSKIPPDSPVRGRILATVHACAKMLGGFTKESIMSKAEQDELNKKLDVCRDPSTRDLVGAMMAAKRNGEEEGKLDEARVKRIKIEREKSVKEGEDLFGPSLLPVGRAENGG
ncbi:hypothetical protein H2203_000254 [Taxawa tesnikishii (nom. ined.)]|nr:hypothetical protein H2203_000254 [Dothideales sp. JES 119]